MDPERRWDYPRLALTSVLAVYGWFLATHPGHFGFVDNIDLAIHETGHLVFAPFGEFMNVLGGTLFQLIVPLTFIGIFPEAARLARGDGAAVVDGTELLEHRAVRERRARAGPAAGGRR